MCKLLLLEPIQSYQKADRIDPAFYIYSISPRNRLQPSVFREFTRSILGHPLTICLKFNILFRFPDARSDRNRLTSP
jgi:hypothetical protein